MTAPAAEQRWPWWPLLPLYPYGRRHTSVRELIPGQVWSFEQLQGLLYVAVPIRMTVVRLQEGLLLYAPLPPTRELRRRLRELEQRHGPVRTIVLPTSSGLEHKLPLPALARAFPQAQVWVSPRQWSFPLRLPPSWLGIPSSRTRILFEQGLPHADQLHWEPLGPLDLGLGTFMEVACLHRASGCLLVTDALVAIGAEPPSLFDADPTPLLFHARDRGDEPLEDTPEHRRRGWQRLVLFACYLRPDQLQVPGLKEQLAQAMAPGLRRPRSYFGLYPFRWLPGWQDEFRALVPPGPLSIQVAPVLERLVFPRCRGALLAWMRRLAAVEGISQLIPAHYEAPVSCDAPTLAALAHSLETRPWAPDGGSWRFLAQLDARLLRWGVVPETPDMTP
ncbi:DUF4336 domain-containing protein [Cyanobium sp. NIES-981]|uniref:DUF4336 domain-containing protein n=1 Tax=Cyanobium sp. NIES-981 TaxID=1851505 RepID=UPI0007DD4611|nr:DUF4336 domain-containing protein [Cyanobium sp. NIES-981]SBO42444.1 conserved protein of unknown function [Cyanobium sp. NIES-981]